MNQTIINKSTLGFNNDGVDGGKQARRDIDEIVHNGAVRVSKEELNMLAHFANELFNVGRHCFEEWDKTCCPGIEEKCNRLGAEVFLQRYYRKHMDLINKIADEKINGEVVDDKS